MAVEHVQGTADQRREARTSLQARIRMRFETEEIEGMTDNISGVGVLFFTEHPLTVSVQVEEGGVLRERTGRIVRAQRMSHDSTGIAIELDPE